ncbi:DNA-binding protein [Deinococcus petrolearius]|uniref:DNA-binding protein n=1 Tax=Deinococcus petrolearius TaxID=1751295 RepID=A0ABW1DHE2_9DEIO
MTDLSIPQKVQDNARKGLKLRDEYGFGGTEVGQHMAEKLAGGGDLSEEEVRHVAAYFPRHAHDHLDQTGQGGAKPSRGYVAWLLWGGDEGRAWSERNVERLDNRDGHGS